MMEFLSGSGGLILGCALLFIAVADYVILRYFWRHINKQNNPELDRLRPYGAYWIALATAGGLYCLLQYYRSHHGS